MADYRKKLIEVALPLDAINDASAYDKMPGIGPHPKGIHHWWARLPLPCARVMLFASLVDDPSEDPAFADKPKAIQDAERDRLFDIIRSLLHKQMHEQNRAFELAHAEIFRCCGDKLPTVLDPFCGGGSIPLEAQRLGLESIGGDLNPIPVLITKALIEILPEFYDHPAINPASCKELDYSRKWQRGEGLAADIRYYSNRILNDAQRRLAQLYPRVRLTKDNGGGEATIIAWLWSRTVICPNPACGGRTPLARSFALSAKKGKRVWAVPKVDKNTKAIAFRIEQECAVPPVGTVNKKGGRCLFCGEPVPFSHIKSEGIQGRIESQLLATIVQGPRNRIYLSPHNEQARIAHQVEPSDFPDTDIPAKALGFRIQPYGMTKHYHLFTPRQLNTLVTFSNLIKEAHGLILADAYAACGQPIDDRPLSQGGHGAVAYADAVVTFLAFGLDRCADFNNSLCRWSPTNEKVMNLFARGAIPMVWDYAEANMLGDSVGSWLTCSHYVAECVEVISAGSNRRGRTIQVDAADSPKYGSNLVVSTDPPYYDNIGYADLSDFFYIWLRHTIGKVHPEHFATVLVPKTPEIVASAERFENNKEKAKEHFETGFKKAFQILRPRLDLRYPMTVYYAFKQSDEEGDTTELDEKSSVISLTTGWEAMLDALISTGFQITGTWPVRASQAWRMRAMGSNALASYIVLACRPRPNDASLSTRRDFQNLLKRELPDALKKLQQGSIAPVDLAQAAIGPGMSIFSRFSKILEADGKPMTVRSALALINQGLDIVLTEQEGEFDADTRFCLAWFEQQGMEDGAFGTADGLARTKDTAVKGLVEAGVLYSRGGKVRLLRREEYNEKWDPTTDRRITVWEVTQHLICLLDKQGEAGAALLLRKVGGIGETARDLAYRLFSICERKKWAQEAMAYNSLVIAWPEIVRLASAGSRPTEQRLFE